MRTLERQYDYDVVYIKMAELLATLSYAKRNKVGALIVSTDEQIISQGYNGTPTGFDNCCEIENEDGTLTTVPETLHAESNAITKCAKNMASTKGSTIYVTLSPCFDCAKLIIQAGISRVVFKDLYRNIQGLLLLEKCGVKVEQINMNLDEDSSWHYKTKISEMQ